MTVNTAGSKQKIVANPPHGERKRQKETGGWLVSAAETGTLLGDCVRDDSMGTVLAAQNPTFTPQAMSHPSFPHPGT